MGKTLVQEAPRQLGTLMVKSGQGLAQRRKAAKVRTGDGVYQQSHRVAREMCPMRMKLTLISHWGTAPGPFLFSFFAGVTPRNIVDSIVSWGCEGTCVPSRSPGATALRILHGILWCYLLRRSRKKREQKECFRGFTTPNPPLCKAAN